MENELVKEIRNQTEILLRNIEVQINEAPLDAMLDNVNNSRFLFHAIHSLDRYFINPYHYKYEAGSLIDVDENLSIISETREGYTAAPGVVIERQKLVAYFDFVKAKIFSYLDNLTDQELTEKPEDCPHTKLALILGQYRHLMFHAGLSEAVNFDTNGTWLEYTGFSYFKNK